MSKQIQFRRGSTIQHGSFTGAVGEITVDTDKDTAVVHDGATVGGFALARESALIAHSTNTSNPHSVTKTQVGLGNVDNTSDANKPISTATQNAFNAQSIVIAGKADQSTTYTKTEVDTSISNVTANALAFAIALG